MCLIVNISAGGLDLESLLNQTFTASLIANWDFYENFSAEVNKTGTVLDLQEALENPSLYKCKYHRRSA